MQVGIVIALPTEWGYFRKAFHLHHERRLGGRPHYSGRFGRLPVSVVLSGVGKENAQEAAALLCQAHRVSALVSLGFAGALSPDLKRGDIVLSARSLQGDSGPMREGDGELERELGRLMDVSHEHHVYVSPLYTADKIIARHQEKAEIYEKSKAMVVDMESMAIYQEAVDRSIPFVGIHAITDTAEEDIPALELINPFLTSRSSWRYAELFLGLLKRPRLIWDLAVLNHDAQVAGRSLTHFLKSNRASLGGFFAKLGQNLRAEAAGVK